MRRSHKITRHLLSCGLCLLPTAQAQDIYSEANFPTPLLLKPGLTQVSGGITTANQSDPFYYRSTMGGSVTVRLRYQHRNGNILTGVSELPHLSGALAFGYYSPPDTFFESGYGPGTTLGAPFILTNGNNTLSATVSTLTENDPAAATRLSVSAPAGKVHPAYTAEFDYQPERDPWENAGNETAQTAVAIASATPGSLRGGTHGSADADWFRFSVPAGRSLRLAIRSAVLTVPLGIQPHQCVLYNASVAPLQTGNNGNVSFIENAGASGKDYLLRITSQDSYAQTWEVSWVLEDALEPNDSIAQARPLAPLAPQGRIEIPGLTLLDDDHYTVQSGLPAGTPFIIAALPDPMKSIHGGGRVIITGGTITTEELRNYCTVTTGHSGIVSFRVTGSVTGYRLLIKPRSAYDVWHRLVAAEIDALPPYLPAASDYDGDGLPAALEWALRLSPFSDNRGAIPPPYFDGSDWRVNVPMPQGGAAADILASESENLVNWTAFPAARNNLGGSIIPAGRTAGAVFTLTRPGAEKNFLRFGVQD